MICGGDSAVFNQPLTIFLVVAMVWRLTVFWLCSKGYSGGRCLADDDRRPAPRLRCGCPWPRMQQAGGQAGTRGMGGGKMAGPSQNGGRVLRHIPFSPPRTRGSGKLPGWVLGIPGGNYLGSMLGFQNFKFFCSLILTVWRDILMIEIS